MHHFLTGWGDGGDGRTDGWMVYMRSVWKKVENALLHWKKTAGQVPNENSVGLSLNIFLCVIYFWEACWWPSSPRWTRHLLARWSLSAADRWEVLWRCADRVAARGGMGSICISVWDPDSSGFSLQPDLLHTCLTVYCTPSTPPTVSRSSHSRHLSFQQDHTHMCDTHTNTNTCRTHVKHGVKVSISWI